MAPTIVVQFDPTPRPVASYSELWGKDPKTLSHWCVKGWIPGAFKHESGAWWVQPLALLNWQPTEPEDVQNDEREEEGDGDSRPNRRKVLRKVDRDRKTRLRRTS